MDEQYTVAAARYLEFNPVKAGLVTRAAEYVWSSASHTFVEKSNLERKYYRPRQCPNEHWRSNTLIL